MTTQREDRGGAASFQEPLVKTMSVAVFAGHSGGHLFPAVAFAEKFRERFPKSRICLLTSSRGRGFFETGRWPFDEIYFVPAFPWTPSLSADFFLFPFKLLKAFLDSYRYLCKMKPDLSVGFGSYASFPGILVSAWRGIPTMIHEQNFVAGRATRWLAKFSDCVTISFPVCPDLEALVPIRFVGLPVRKSLLDGASFKKKGGGSQDSGTPVFSLLVVGGSQGSHRINQAVIQALAMLNDEEKKTIAVNHITGFQDEKWATGEYLQKGIQAQVHPFCGEMNRLYQKADMAITRAGANTLFELALFELPAIVIPYPFAARHQSSNAQYFSDHGGVLYKEEERLTPEWILGQIREWMRHPEKRRQVSENISKLATPRAGDELVSFAEKLMAGRI